MQLTLVDHNEECLRSARLGIQPTEWRLCIFLSTVWSPPDRRMVGRAVVGVAARGRGAVGTVVEERVELLHKRNPNNRMRRVS